MLPVGNLQTRDLQQIYMYPCCPHSHLCTPMLHNWMLWCFSSPGWLQFQADNILQLQLLNKGSWYSSLYCTCQTYFWTGNLPCHLKIIINSSISLRNFTPTTKAILFRNKSELFLFLNFTNSKPILICWDKQRNKYAWKKIIYSYKED